MGLHPALSFSSYSALLPTFSAVQVATGLPFFLILFCLFVVPLGIYSPCLQEKDELGPKPGLFGHRGAPMVGVSLMGVSEHLCAWALWARGGDLRISAISGEEKGLALNDKIKSSL